MPLYPINELVLDGYDISTHGFQTDYYCVWDSDNVGIEAIVQNGTAPTGNFIVEASCELYSPVQFAQIVCEEQAITDNSIILWQFVPNVWNWVRVSYVRTSGTGEVTLYINKKVIQQ